MKKVNLHGYGDKLLFAIALAILAGALFSLSSREKISGTSAESILVFAKFQHNEIEHDVITNLIEEFENLHDGIRIVVDNRFYEEISHDFFDPSNEIKHADIFLLDALWVSDLLEHEIIINPSPPLLSSINVLYYNIDILREAGFSRPPGNRSEFLNYSRAVSGENCRGLVMHLNSARGVYDDVFPWIWAAGTTLINNGNPAFSTNPVIAALTFLSSLYNEGLVLNTEEGKLQDFIQGRAAFMLAPAGHIGLLLEHMGEESFSLTSIPGPDNYAGRTLFASQELILAINSSSPHIEEAQLFMDFLVENAPLFTGQNRAVASELYSKVWEIEMAGEKANDFNNLALLELSSAFREELQALFTGSYTVAEMAAAIQRRWILILNE